MALENGKRRGKLRRHRLLAMRLAGLVAQKWSIQGKGFGGNIGREGGKTAVEPGAHQEDRRQAPPAPAIIDAQSQHDLDGTPRFTNPLPCPKSRAAPCAPNHPKQRKGGHPEYAAPWARHLIGVNSVLGGIAPERRL